ncbi:hypothetical protein KJ953_00740 [Patescibacteria group bacterium]|nr:hypothetical protein [Patescibacteria group bacterium]
MNTIKKLLILQVCLAAIWSIFPIQAYAIDPQYIFVRKNPMYCNPSDCSQLWNMANPNLDLYPGIIDIYNKVGHGTDQRKLGIGVEILYFEYDFNAVRDSLEKLLDYSKIHTVPIFLSLGGFQWWDTQPNLWNWWDPNGPGYNLNNKNNVEWTCGNSSCALRKSWRNWGNEIEVKPHPNLASRPFIDANKNSLDQLIPIIVNWYDNDLSTDQKWLFGGISLGIEIDIGGNYYYPGGGIGSSQQLGYAAINTLGLSGITTANFNTIVRNYINELDKKAFDLGIPRNKIFNHIGGSDLLPPQNNLVHQTAEASVSTYGNPGWSFYDDITKNPQNYPGLSTSLDQVGNNTWASPEWLTFAGNYDGWVQALRASLNYRNNRFINIANWEEIRDHQYILDAINTVVNENPTCWVAAPQMQSVNVNGDTVTLTWQKGTNNDAVYLNISTVGDFNVTGIFKTINIANENVTNLSSWTKNNLNGGKYYWGLIADGCGNQRKIADGSFMVGSLPGDANADGLVNTADYTIWANHYPQAQSGQENGDFNQDNQVNGIDYTIWLNNFAE